APTARFDLRLSLLAEESRALRSHTTVHLHLGAAHVTARIAALDAERIEPGETVLARLTLDRAIGALARDRLVLRDAAATRTIGGGVVIDPFPPRRGGRTTERRAQLAALDQPDPLAALYDLLALPPGWTDRAVYLRARNLPASKVEPSTAVEVGDVLMSPAGLAAMRQELPATLAAHHAAAPDQPGLQLERLRTMMPGRPPAAAFRAVIAALVDRGVVRHDGPWLRLPSHQVTLSVQDERIWREVHDMIAADRFRPPRTRDLARALSVPEAAMRRTLKRVQRMGRLIEVAPDQFFLSETVAEMAGIAADIAAGAASGTVTAATFRDQLANGRKVAIQVLEFFDRAGITVRVGDERRVRADRRGAFGPSVQS
ncbi:MAG TPA: SelB C-terminal domain-containing protein, partial [Acetobacteraceae bacterium]|nr:SelB C-terminal domain-containing protein [Acetobacteraceae bacterium]